MAISIKEGEVNDCRCFTIGSAKGAAGNEGIVSKHSAKFISKNSTLSFCSCAAITETSDLYIKGAKLFLDNPKWNDVYQGKQVNEKGCVWTKWIKFKNVQ